MKLKRYSINTKQKPQKIKDMIVKYQKNDLQMKSKQCRKSERM